MHDKSTGLKKYIRTSVIKCQKSKSESYSLGATERVAPTQKVNSNNKLIVKSAGLNTILAVLKNHNYVEACW